MRYVVTTAPGHMELRTGPAPETSDTEAVVRIERVGLCGGDYSFFHGSHPYARYPQIQGHELVGLVEHLPPGYAGPLSTGQRVAIEPLVSCGGCFACRRGRYNCCVRLQVLGAHIPGGLAELFAAPVDRLYPTGSIPADVAVLVEPMSIGLEAIARGGVGPDDAVVVIGAGPIGLFCTVGAVDRGARVLTVDQVASRLEHAARLGASRVVDTSSEDLAAAVLDFTGGEGPAVVIEATGVPSLVRLAVELVAPSGTVVVVGLSTKEVSIPIVEFSRKELNLLGSRNNAGLFGSAVDVVTRNAERLAPLVTRIVPLQEIAKAIEHASTHPDEVVKVVIRVSD
jgi:threonine dehydrogenase-like Zn-dependent dehydrogenase